MRRVSLNARLSENQIGSAEIQVALFLIDHPDIEDGPIKLSTDSTSELSLEPHEFGTWSTWLDDEYPEAAGEPFKFVLASALLPSDQEDAPATATLILEAVDQVIAETLRSTTTQATVHMAGVMASSPDLIEVEYRDLRLVSSEGDISEVRLQLTHEPVTEESFPTGRMTKERFPGMRK